jgi:hypothetical protein
MQSGMERSRVSRSKVDTLPASAREWIISQRDLLVKLLNRSARSIKDGKQQTSQVVSLDLLLGIVWLLLFVIFRRRE